VEDNKYLLDTHIILWWLSDPTSLSKEAQKCIRSDSEVFLSAAAIWEMSIKSTLGRLEIPNNLLQLLKVEKIFVLDISAEHALAVRSLPLIHQDPFDRIQIAQAQHEEMILITRDRIFKEYDVPLVKG
jgi:PIN domain nuclease of toxin-antitoxin system